MSWSVQPEAVLASAAAESVISAETEAAAAAAAPALLGTTPMGDDPDSATFASALNACGASYLGVVAEHAAQRGLFAGAQGLASGVYVATEAARQARCAGSGCKGGVRMPDPGWAARTPEANDLLLKAGTGVGTHLANQTAWIALGATHHASGIASAINTAATSASWLGAGSAASATNVTMLNASLHGLAGWVDVKPAVVATAVSAFQTANGAMRPAPECIANRDEYVADNIANPSVLGDVDPANRLAGRRVLRRDVAQQLRGRRHLRGDPRRRWPKACQLRRRLRPWAPRRRPRRRRPRRSVRRPPRPRPATGCAPPIRACRPGQPALVRRHRAARTLISQVSTFMEPVQSMMGAVPQALQAPSGLLQAPMSSMQPLQSMMGMFANPGAMGGAVPGVRQCRRRCDFGRRGRASAGVRRRRRRPGRRRRARDQLHPPRQRL